MGCPMSKCGVKFAGSESVDAFTGGTNISVRTWEPKQKIGDSTTDAAAATNQCAWTPVIVCYGRLLDQASSDKSHVSCLPLGSHDGDVDAEGHRSPNPTEKVITEVVTVENRRPQHARKTASEGPIQTSEHDIHLEGADVFTLVSDAAKTSDSGRAHAPAHKSGRGPVSDSNLVSSPVETDARNPESIPRENTEDAEQSRDGSGSLKKNSDIRTDSKGNFIGTDGIGDVLSSLPKDVQPVLAHETIWKVLNDAPSGSWTQIVPREFDTYGQQWVEYRATSFSTLEEVTGDPDPSSSSYRLPLFGLDAAPSDVLQGFVDFVNKTEGSDIFGVRWVKLNLNDHRWGLNEALTRPHRSSSIDATNALSEEEVRPAAGSTKDNDAAPSEDRQQGPQISREGVQAPPPMSGTSTTGVPRPQPQHQPQEHLPSLIYRSVSYPDTRNLQQGSSSSSGGTPISTIQQTDVHIKHSTLSTSSTSTTGRSRSSTQDSPAHLTNTTVSYPDTRNLQQGSSSSSGGTPISTIQQTDVHIKHSTLSTSSTSTTGISRSSTQDSLAHPTNTTVSTSENLHVWNVVSSQTSTGPPIPPPQEVAIPLHPTLLTTENGNMWSFFNHGAFPTPSLPVPQQQDVQGVHPRPASPRTQPATQPKSVSKDCVSGNLSGNVSDLTRKPPGYIGPPPVVFGGNAVPLEVEQVPNLERRRNLRPPFTQSRPRAEPTFRPVSHRSSAFQSVVAPNKLPRAESVRPTRPAATPQSVVSHNKLVVGSSSHSTSSHRRGAGGVGGGAQQPGSASVSTAVSPGHKIGACRNADQMGVLFWGPRTSRSRLTL